MTNGATGNPNDLHEMKRLREMGWSYRSIAQAFGLNVKTVTRWLNPQQRERQLAMWRARDEKRRLNYLGVPGVADLGLRLGKEPRASDDLLQKRDELLARPHRDLTAMLLGDPRVGQSALDRKLERAGA